MTQREQLNALMNPDGPTRIMGVVNVTPDSFSDGGQWFEPEAAINHGLELAAAGADILDVGGESTRPGAPRVSVADELRRVLPVVQALAGQGAIVSIDTTRAEVAQQAIAHGASIINDVSGGLAEPEILKVAAQADLPYIIMHWRGPADVMDDLDDYQDVVAQVRQELQERISAARAAGIAQHNLIIDPGLGFAKAGESNWPLLSDLAALTSLGYPVLVGASRKRFLGHLLAQQGEPPVAPLERDVASATLAALACLHGAWAVRVHNVGYTRDALAVAQRWQSTKNAPSAPRT